MIAPETPKAESIQVEEPHAVDIESDNAVCDDNAGSDDNDRLKTEEHKPIVTARETQSQDTSAGRERSTRECPKCGWEEDIDAKFCSVCRCNFNKTEPLNLAQLQNGQLPDNPLRRSAGQPFDPAEMMSWFEKLPNSMKFGGLAGLVILLLLIIFGR